MGVWSYFLMWCCDLSIEGLFQWYTFCEVLLKVEILEKNKDVAYNVR